MAICSTFFSAQNLARILFKNSSPFVFLLIKKIASLVQSVQRYLQKIKKRAFVPLIEKKKIQSIFGK